MKKTLALLLCTSLVITAFAGCGKKPAPEPYETTTPTESTTSNAELNLQQTLRHYQNKVAKIAINRPKTTIKEIKDIGKTHVFETPDNKFYTITVNDNEKDITRIPEAQESAVEQYKKDMETYFTVDSYTIDIAKNTNINNHEYYFFEATYKVTNKQNNTKDTRRIIGYSFISEGVPCTIIGTGITKANDKEEKMKENLALVRNIEFMVRTMVFEKELQTIK